MEFELEMYFWFILPNNMGFKRCLHSQNRKSLFSLTIFYCEKYRS